MRHLKLFLKSLWSPENSMPIIIIKQTFYFDTFEEFEFNMPTGKLHLPVVKDNGWGFAIGRCCMERGYSNGFQQCQS